MFIPALKLARDPERGGNDFLRLLGRAYADPAPFIRQFLAEQYALMIARFKAAFGRALPDLPKTELSWRLHFIMGALSYTLAGTDALRLIAELTPARNRQRRAAAAAPRAVSARRPDRAAATISDAPHARPGHAAHALTRSRRHPVPTHAQPCASLPSHSTQESSC